MYHDPNQSGGKLESIAHYFFLGAVILAPLMFWPSAYVSQDIVKTLIIVLGTIVPAILFGFVAIKEKRLTLPPKSMTRLSVLMVVSLLVSAFTSIQADKSIFGQGFEVGTVSFILTMFLAALVSFTVIVRRPERAIIAYVGMVAAFIILYVFQTLRLVFGADFISLGILNSVTSSILGGWYNLGSYSIVVAIISLLAIKFLSPSGRMKIVYWIIAVLSMIGAVIVNDSRAWIVAGLVFLGLTIYLTLNKSDQTDGNISFFKKIAWIPLVAFLLSVLFFYQGNTVAGPTINRINAGYSELSLPWQMTLDVTASSIKNFPIFGVGSNHFTQAYLAYKPTGINQTNAWGTEFTNGFGLIPTFIATQGLFGTVIWILFFVFFGLLGARALTRLPQEAETKFLLVSSFAVSTFLWLMMIVSVPSNTMIFYAFIVTGMFMAIGLSSGSFKDIKPCSIGNGGKLFTPVMIILVLIAVIWGLIYAKKIIAFSYFASGVKQLTVTGDAKTADTSFSKAISFDASDIYWQARAEASLTEAKKIAATITANTAASTSEAAVAEIASKLKDGVSYTDKAIAYDNTNYYNYLSKARLSEAGASINIPNAYDAAVGAYASAINLNPYNPSIYLSLASLQVNTKKYDDALRTAGAALQVKNNYLDAVFLLSQIYVAKGDLPNAIVAAKVATQLNPSNAMLFFQLGILDYNNKDYSNAADSLAQAVKLQSDYSNAKYFLGLSYARLGTTTAAIVQFEDLAKTNPDNQEVGLILTNLKAGKSIFNDVKAPMTTAPEKRAKLPIKEKR